jgi:hypothetical protein
VSHHEDVWRSGYIIPLFLNVALDGGELSASRLFRFNPVEKDPRIYWMGGWMGTKGGTDRRFGKEKKLLP